MIARNKDILLLIVQKNQIEFSVTSVAWIIIFHLKVQVVITNIFKDTNFRTKTLITNNSFLFQTNNDNVISNFQSKFVNGDKLNLISHTNNDNLEN